MSVPDMPVNVPVDDPNADTEWNDILRKHGIIPEKPPSPTAIVEEAILEAQRLMHENRLEGKDLDELDELEDEEDDAFLEVYRYIKSESPFVAARKLIWPRQKRLNELSNLRHKSAHGSVYPISKPSYAISVTEASTNGATVLVNLVSPAMGHTESRILSNLWRQVAEKFPDIKFCEMRADLAIEGYPERNCPTILIYQEGDIVKQIVTLKELGGVRTTLEGECISFGKVSGGSPCGLILEPRRADIERILVEVKAVKPADFRLRRKKDDDEDQQEEARRNASSIRFSQAGKRRNPDDDDDWD